MNSADLVRFLLLSQVFIFGWSICEASADPIGISNNSFAFAGATIHHASDWEPIFAQEIYDSSGSWPSNIGVSTLGKSVMAAANDATSSGAHAGALVEFLISFTLTEPHQYTYTGQYSSERSASASAVGSDFGTASLFRQSVNGSEGIFLDVLNVPALATTQSGVLEPAFYGLVADFGSSALTCISGNVVGCSSGLRTADTGSAGFNFRFDLTPAPTPEPATLVLFGTGLVRMERPALIRSSWVTLRD